LGGIPSPFDCYLVLRGLKTLEIRMEKHMKNALKIAKWLETNPRIERVLYPPLESHPQHDLYLKQMSGFGGMMGVYLKANLEQTSEFLKQLNIAILAVSLGGYETLVEHPAIMTHLAVPKETRDELGISDNFLRVSIGLEDPEDLINDFQQALEKAIPIV
jgi:cystathionine gamma-lyase